MKVLHLSTSDINGGAARGTYWMHTALKRAGIDSHMLVAEKYTSDDTVIGPNGITGGQKILNGIRQTVEYWPLKRYPHKSPGLFSPAIYPNPVIKQIEQIKPDIINLHWVGLGLLRPEQLKTFTQPIVWTLRDMWSFTGGCCYTAGCTRYQQQCGRCPMLGSKQENDLSRKVWQRKHRAWQGLNLTLAPISQWLADCASKSSLLHHYPARVIPNAVDTDIFRPIDQKAARDILQLPQHDKLILFGALSATTDKRKGFNHLVAAIKQLKTTDSLPLRAVIFGTEKTAVSMPLNIPYTVLGRLNDDITLALAYSAADVMVVPSIQEAFGKTAIEAMACGTPVVCFDATGLRDIVEHQKNGYRAECFSAADLAKGIFWSLEDTARLKRLGQQARQDTISNFSFEVQSAAYAELYQALLR
ncbi:group 1 glycosyl transferase [Leptolyngbya sp. Heron Island J]|uniref:glycosyltransferase family 4 protein n=1 Tax=Leptolyngbya sp. Heron Island J TaxID=1385935 RepID=UPI0003B9E101|nr:glycosyltransferase family 4 protein [Leptolyngbya sp. Heron Island J]ESA32697.1 group 1 glycosyl transferase [Leptolyngbya sp. Heron Island J]